jgi:hypothetical protein
MGEKLIQCDVSDLTNLPQPGSRARLFGTLKQTSWATNLREALMEQWKPDLPAEVFNALWQIEDATWWLANKDAAASEIKWPESWVNGRNRATGQAPPQGKTLMEVFAMEEAKKNGGKPVSQTCQEQIQTELERRRKLGPVGVINEAAAEGWAEREEAARASLQDIEQFKLFVAKMSKSPELAYLTMLALGYRATRDPQLHRLYEQERERLDGHVNAITTICGPGPRPQPIK